jgi:hypothetical protein
MSGRRIGYRSAGIWSGRGRVFRGKEFVMEVSYVLKRVEEIYPHEPGGTGQGPKEDEGHGHTRGAIEGSGVARLLGDTFTLHLKDGSCVDIIPHQKITEDSVIVVASGEFYKPES